MFYGQQIADTRTYFFTTWAKYQAKHPLNPLESQLLTVILQHPEYHDTLNKNDTNYQYHPELGMSNPFLHMGLHLALRDQIALDKPQGIKEVFQNLLERHSDFHHAEHLCLEQLALSLWHAQQNQSLPDEEAYLAACRLL